MKYLKEKHPTLQKFLKLMDTLDDLGLTLTFPGSGCNPQLLDKDQPEMVFEIKDIEPNHCFDSLPPETEYIITIKDAE